MTTQIIVLLALVLPTLYLAARWARARLAMRRLRRLSHRWGEAERTWEALGSLSQGVHSQNLRTAFASLQRGRLTQIQAIAPNHEPARVHLRLTSQFLRGHYIPAAPSTRVNTKTKLAAARALRADLQSKDAKTAVEAGLTIRADAELNQWQARLELDDFAATAMRDALLGKKREALVGIKQAFTCLPRLPIKDADAWRIKLGAEQRRLRMLPGARAA